MRRRHASLLRTLAIGLVVGLGLLLIATFLTGPWVYSPIEGVCGRWGGPSLGFPRPFYWQCYGPPLAAGGSMVYPAVYDGVAFTVDAIFWYLAALGLVLLRYWPFAPQRPSISSSGILPPLASSSDDIGLTPPGEESPAPSGTKDIRTRKAKR